MITNLLSQHELLTKCLSGIESLINEAYRASLPFKEGDRVFLSGHLGVVAEITYFSPIKVFLFRKDGGLSKVHRVAKNVGDIEVI